MSLMDLVDAIVDFIGALADLGSPDDATRSRAKWLWPIMALVVLLVLALWLSD